MQGYTCLYYHFHNLCTVYSKLVIYNKHNLFKNYWNAVSADILSSF